MKEYKVFVYSESILSTLFFGEGKIVEENLEKALNSLAKQGWIVKAVERETRRTLLFSKREAFVFILERDKK
ncbi:MAG: DUF4177 domain-containing protein [Alphaproteobacteria bacterium]|nr:DUF4177 domain-containing protein [Alphaproteobacteria bacterium]